VPQLIGQSVRGVTEVCSRLGLTPLLVGSGVAVEQSPEAGTRVVRGSRISVRFGRAEAVPVAAPESEPEPEPEPEKEQ
jgi:beta-lactam-binding protein with PASTA domain